MKKDKKLRKQTTVRQLLRPYTGGVVWLCVLAALSSVLQVYFAVVSRYVIDTALTRSLQLPLWGAALVAILLALVAIHAVQNWLAGSVTDRCVAGLRHALLDAAAYSNEKCLHVYHSGELLSRGMEDVHIVCDGAVSALPSMVGQISRLVFSFGAVLMLYPPLAVLVLIGSAVVAAAVAGLRPILKAHYASVRKADSHVMADMQESLQQMELIQCLGAQQQMLQRFDSRLQHSLEAKRKRRRWTVGYHSVLSAVSQLGSGILLLWGAGLVAVQTLSYGSLTAMIQLLNLLRSPILGLSGLWTRLAGVEVAAERLSELLQPAQKPADVEIGVIQAVVFENVYFSYPDDDTPVLEDFSARLPLEQWACLTGVSGKGKTTLFKLMLGLYTPQQGRVYLDTDAGQISCGVQTRCLFAYVPQDYALLSGTVLDNLLLAVPDATEEARRTALHTAQADFVWELTGAEQTPVRENNAGLSKGQLQRLAIARAVLMDRPIFLLDECTSALDAKTEYAVLQSLHALGKQAILVTHRPDAVGRLAHVQIVALDGRWTDKF